MSVLEGVWGLLIWLGIAWLAVSFTQKKRALVCFDAGSVSRVDSILRMGFFALLLAALLTSRTPALQLAHGLNPDEEQFMATALKYRVDPVPWRSSDGGSAGPLVSYVLVWPLLLGMKLDYFNARLTGVALVFITLAFYVKTACLIVGDRFARLAVLPVLAFYIFAFKNEYVRYTSEYLSIALLAAGVYLAVKNYVRPRVASCFALGVVLGATPFTKIQAAPLAVYLFGVAVVLLLARKGWPPNLAQVKTGVAALIAGGLVVPAIILIPVFAVGCGRLFFDNYVLYASNYNRDAVLGSTPTGVLPTDAGLSAHAAVPTPPGALAKLLLVLGHRGETVIYLGTLMILGLILIAAANLSRSRRPVPLRWWVGFIPILLYLLLSYYVILKPGTNFQHYFLLCTGSITLLFLWVSRFYVRYRAGQTITVGCAIGIVALVTLPCLAWRAWDPFLDSLANQAEQTRPASDPAVQFIDSHERPGDSLVVWGWAPRFYVATQLSPGTSDTVGGAYLLPGAENEMYRARFLEQMEQSRPHFFVDAVGEFYPPGWPRPVERCRFTSYPAIADYVAKHYTLALTQEPGANINARWSGSLPILVYVRRD